MQMMKRYLVTHNVAAMRLPAVLRSPHVQVFIVDFGFADDLPSSQRAASDPSYRYMAFGGTPDYASKDALLGFRCSAKVSLEM